MKTKYPYFDNKIKVLDLILDKENPRLPRYLQEKSEQEIIQYMILEEATLELMQAIGKNNFFQGEQLLVVPNDTGGYTVVEGNRRLTAVKLLNDPNLNGDIQKSLVDKIYQNAEYKNIEYLPCTVFEKKEDIQNYLGYRHITGIQSWNLIQKASYLYHLRKVNFPDLSIDQASDELRKMIASKRNYVKRVLVGYSIYQTIKESNFFEVKNLDEKSFHFSYIADSLRFSEITTYLGINLNDENPLQNLAIEKLKDWTNWLYLPIEREGKIPTTRLKGKSQDLKKLNDILGNENAKKEFIEHNATLIEAHSYTDEFDNIFFNSISSGLKNLKKAKSITSKINSFYLSLEDNLGEIITLSREIKKLKDEQEQNPFDDDKIF